ncbi:MAG: hypothetical protein B7Y15_00760 [Bacteroidetes bacterium 24-39-8]|jgi:hypothetical protein|nr:MAG: hypothetical protein B7Y69_01660 [Sphingobacteriia bacterium 35-40-8]OYZ53035.1 MAG: hypothetical protein B7Y15_00760 [Bacteroidetes bacterium 24-39-8]OZA65344.1 MAG: hypothetical protein B7X72_07610 [Sphingobacteriia bacterium 39-39-8]
MASVQYFCCKPIFLKQFLFLIFLLSLHLALLAQKDSVKPVANKTAVAKPSPSLKSVGAIKPKVDSLKKPLLDTARVQQDSTGIKDSLAKQVLLDSLQLDSTKKALQLQILAARPDTSTYAKYLYSKYLPFQGQAIQQFSQERKRDSQELLFYILTGLVGILAAIRLIFPKYFKNLFLLVMQTSVRQKQTREQLLQNNLASILLNFLFLASAGLYVSLLVQHKHWVNLPFYQLVLYSCLLLLVVYLGKFLFLSFSGWVFNVGDATNAYTFIVFLVNKVLGIILIPFVLVLTYSPEPIMQIATTISLGICALLFVYRYLIGFGAIRNNLKVSALHFFLYLCAVELLPLVLIYKLLLDNLTGSI